MNKDKTEKEKRSGSRTPIDRSKSSSGSISTTLTEKESKPDDSIIMETEQDIKDSNKQKSIFKRFIDWLKR